MKNLESYFVKLIDISQVDYFNTAYQPDSVEGLCKFQNEPTCPIRRQGPGMFMLNIMIEINHFLKDGP